MIESMVITLREGIEAALVVGIILTYLNKTGKNLLKPQVYRGLFAAVAASIAFAIILRIFGINPDNEYFEGTVMVVAGLLVASLVVWMWRAAKNVKQETEEKLTEVVGRKDQKSRGWGLFVFTFVMVFREGAETVLFLISTTLGQFSMFNLIGGMTGIALAVLFAFFFIRGSLRINLSRFFSVTSVVLLVLALKLVLGGIHEFAERGVMPMTKDAMSVIGYFVRGNTSTAILMALLAVPLLAVLWSARTATPVAGEGETAAARRKRLATKQQERMWRFGLAAAAVFILIAMGTTIFAGSGYTDPEPAAVSASISEVRIPVASLESGKLAKFTYRQDGLSARFMVVRYPGDAVAVVLDACQICGSVGYGQDGENAICKNCNAPIALDSVGQGGGCNPLPLAFMVQKGDIVIATTDLVQAAQHFK